MKLEDYNAAVRPKVLGTWNLHQQSLSMNLDFFIMLSSLTGMVGNSSQCNYAAGNTFENAVARHRTVQGLPGVSLDLGPIKSVGYVSETAGVAERLKRAGTTMLEEEEMLRLIERGIIMPRPAMPTLTLARSSRASRVARVQTGTRQPSGKMQSSLRSGGRTTFPRRARGPRSATPSI